MNINLGSAVLLLSIFFFVPKLIFGQENLALEAFAESYWQAIASGNEEDIYSLYDPEVFEMLTPAQVAFMKDSWRRGYEKASTKQGDSYEITTKTLDSASKPLPEWRWASVPEFQIEIQTFKNIAHGKEGFYGITDVVVSRDGNFYITRPIPQEDELNKAMNNAG